MWLYDVHFYWFPHIFIVHKILASLSRVNIRRAKSELNKWEKIIWLWEGFVNPKTCKKHYGGTNWCFGHVIDVDPFVGEEPMSSKLLGYSKKKE